MYLTVFDDNYKDNFFPLTLTRSVGDLRCGILKQRQRLQSFVEDEECSVIIDPALEELYIERHPDWMINSSSRGDTLYLNSRLRVDDKCKQSLLSLPKESAYFAADGSLIALRTAHGAKSFAELISIAATVTSSIDTGIQLYMQLADLIHDNARMICWDFANFFYDAENFMETEPGVSLLDPYNIWIGEGTSIKPGVVLDASSGPIVIDNDVVIMPNAVICGPAYIGKKSVIKIAAKIYPGTSIGPVCKIGGEVEGSIFQAYSNKQHEGFIGHSYIGEWVNLGADTNNSDLKNTYKNVAYYSYSLQKKIDSGTMFLGTVIGDHTKLGINCTINTGCVIGTASNLWGSDLLTDYIPPFSWGTALAIQKYRYEAFMQTLELVKSRRKINTGNAERQLYKSLSEQFAL